jgi:hypothetical protein
MFCGNLRVNVILFLLIILYPCAIAKVIITNTSIFTEKINVKSFSGFYTLLNQQSLAERFAASWLTTRGTFTNDEYIGDLRNARNIESVTLALMNSGLPVMTRDYFDLQGKVYAYQLHCDVS